MDLSVRLQMNADMVPRGCRLCDLLEYLSQRAVISEVFCDGVG